MKHKNLQSCLIAFFLSFCLGYSSVGSVLSGYSLRADPETLAIWCLLISAILTLALYSRYRSWFCLGVVSLLILTVLFSKTFQQQMISMVSIIIDFFAKAYQLAAPEFSVHTRYARHLLPLLMLHGLISFAGIWVLLYRQSVFFVAIPAIVVLGSCFLTLDSTPETGYILLWLFAFILILLTHPVRIQNPLQGIRLTKLLALPVALALLLALVFIPPDGSTVPEVDEWDFTQLFDQHDAGGIGQTVVPGVTAPPFRCPMRCR